MLSPQQQRLSRQEQARFGLPEAFKTVSPFPFAGMNTQASRLALADPEAFWVENLVKLGDGNVRSVPDRGDALYAVQDARVSISFASFNIGMTNYFVLFFSDGSAVQVEYPGGAVKVMSPAASGAFYASGGFFPATVQWGSTYLLIANNNTQNDYWAWDGTILYGAGTLGPQFTLTSGGTNYVIPPTVTVFGGHGSGAIVEATVNNGSVVDLTIVNPGTGYVPGDHIQALFSGGGSDTSAELVALLQPVPVAAVVVLAGGTGYATAPTVNFVGGFGSGAAATAVVSGGVVVSITLDNGGTGYASAPTVTFTGSGGTGAQAQATLVPAGVLSVDILNRGTNFFGVPTLTFVGGGGTGAAARPILSGPGPLSEIRMTAGGTGYTTIPAVAITDNGTGATADATVLAGEVTAFVVTAGGAGYTAAPRIIVDGDGQGALGQAVLTADAVTSINLLSGGSGYTAATVRIQGGTGSGATAEVTGIANGVITEITITNDGGENYTDPQVAITGGGGANATATAAIGAGEIVEVVVDHPGHGYTSAPTVIVQSGTSGAASALLTLMPFGISGTSLETYQSQVWVQQPHQSGSSPTGGVRVSSAPNSISDFATSSGGLSETSTDRFLRRRLTALRQSNGFLYPFGDSSTGVISNVQVQGDPPTKTLTNQNTDPQTGTNWRDTIQDFSRTILFANPLGVWGLFGGAVTKISGKMDGVFNNALFPSGNDPLEAGAPLTPTAAVANLYNQKVYLLLMTVRDPFTAAYRNVMLAWIERSGRDQEWSIISQSGNPVYIGTQEIDSNLRAWATNGRELYPLLDTPSRQIIKKWATKLWGADRPYVTKLARTVWMQAENFADSNSAPSIGLSIDTEFATFGIAPPRIAFPFGTLPPSAERPAVQCPVLMATTGDIAGQYLGFTLASVEEDFALYNAMMAHEDIGVLFT